MDLSPELILAGIALIELGPKVAEGLYRRIVLKAEVDNENANTDKATAETAHVWATNYAEMFSRGLESEQQIFQLTRRLNEVETELETVKKQTTEQINELTRQRDEAIAGRAEAELALARLQHDGDERVLKLERRVAELEHQLQLQTQLSSTATTAATP